MAFRSYTIDDLQLQLKEELASKRAEGRDFHRNSYYHLTDELFGLGRWDLVELEKRRDRLARLGYDADAIIAGIDPLAAETERQRRRELVSNERLALLRLGIMRKHNDGSWCKPELNDTHPARCERRREIKFKVDVLRARFAVEWAINRVICEFIHDQLQIAPASGAVGWVRLLFCEKRPD